MGEGHVLGTDLDRQEVVAEGRERSGGKHKEDHDGGVHGHQLQVELRGHHVAGSAVLGQQVQSRDSQIRPAQVEAHEPGEEHPNQHRRQGEPVILLADDFMVEAEDVLADEAGWRSMLSRVSVRCIVHWVTSKQRSHRRRHCGAPASLHCLFLLHPRIKVFRRQHRKVRLHVVVPQTTELRAHDLVAANLGSGEMHR